MHSWPRMSRTRELRGGGRASLSGAARLVGAITLLAAVLIGAAVVPARPARAQTDSAPVTLSGTLRKVHDAGAVTLAYRTSSVPFSFMSPRGEPIGYSIEICRSLVAALGEQLGRELAIRWLPVSAEDRMQAVMSGQADFECGSTTANAERRRSVAFSPTIFIAGTKLLVRRDSPIQSFRDLGGKAVVVTAGTTNEGALRELAGRFHIDMRLTVARDHGESYGRLAAGEADAFATDDVLLYGLIALHRAQAQFHVVGEFLSYEPYAIMYRKDDEPLQQVVRKAFQDLAADDEFDRQYTRWFMRPLPSGQSLDLPMSSELATILHTLAPSSQ